MDAAAVLVIFCYAGLLVFSINGLQLIALRNKQKEMQITEDRILKLLLRIRMRK